MLRHRNLFKCSLCDLKLYNRSQLNAHAGAYNHIQVVVRLINI